MTTRKPKKDSRKNLSGKPARNIKLVAIFHDPRRVVDVIDKEAFLDSLNVNELARLEVLTPLLDKP